jgi:hypothetical protein
MATIALLVASSAGAGSAAAAPADRTIPAAAADAALAATRAQAAATGMRYRTIWEDDDEYYERSAAGDVVVLVEAGEVMRVWLLGDGRYEPMNKYERNESFTNDPWHGQVWTRYGYATNPFLRNMGATGEEATLLAAKLLDPFGEYARDENAQVVVDARGRATTMIVFDNPHVEVLAWTAPRAVRPVPNAMVPEADHPTMSTTIDSTDALLEDVSNLGSTARAFPGFKGNPVGTLRKVARYYGWPVSDVPGGVSMTVTEPVGSTWRIRMTARRTGVKVAEFALLSVPSIMTFEEAITRRALGMTSAIAVDMLTCDTNCYVRNMPGRLTAARALEVASTFGSAATIGVSGDGASLSGSIAFQQDGYCFAVPLQGSTFLQRPSSWVARPGSAAPNGTCQ